MPGRPSRATAPNRVALSQWCDNAERHARGAIQGQRTGPSDLSSAGERGAAIRRSAELVGFGRAQGNAGQRSSGAPELVGYCREWGNAGERSSGASELVGCCRATEGNRWWVIGRSAELVGLCRAMRRNARPPSQGTGQLNSVSDWGGTRGGSGGGVIGASVRTRWDAVERWGKRRWAIGASVRTRRHAVGRWGKQRWAIGASVRSRRDAVER